MAWHVYKWLGESQKLRFFVGLSTLSLPGWSQNLMDKTHSNWVLSTKPRPCDIFWPHLGFLLLQQTPALEHLMSDLCRPKQSKMCFKGWFLATWRQVPQAPQVPLFGYAFRGHSFPSHLLGSRSFNIAQITRSAFGRMLPVAAILLIVESARCDFPTSYIFTFWHMRTSLAFCPILHRYSATVKVSAMIA